MADEKSPGEDGITGEFYKHFKNDIIDDLTELLNNCLLRGKKTKII